MPDEKIRKFRCAKAQIKDRHVFVTGIVIIVKVFMVVDNSIIDMPHVVSVMAMAMKMVALNCTNIAMLINMGM